MSNSSRRFTFSRIDLFNVLYVHRLTTGNLDAVTLTLNACRHGPLQAR